MAWCLAINIGVLIFSTLVIMLFSTEVKSLHSKLSHVPVDKLDELYFAYLGNFKLAILIFNLAPYIALRVMA